MYEMLVENHPTRGNLIRKQLKAEYGVDPVSDQAKGSDRAHDNNAADY